MVRWATFILAAIGLAIGIYTAATASREAPRVPLAGQPSVNPFEHGIAAQGMVEAASRNIPVAAPEGGLVVRVLVEVGQRVKTGDPLFELDSRPLQADLVKAAAARDDAAAGLARLEAQPRAETIPPLEAAVASARAEVEDLQGRLERWKAVEDRRAVSEDEFNRVRYSLEAARARLEQARANLALARAGAWSADLEVERADLAQAKAQVDAIQVLIDRRTVRSPIDGTVLKRNLEPGQFATAETASVQQGSMVVGDLSRLRVRARVDEEDLPLLRSGAKAVARVRGRVSITAPLTMLRIEPLALPKTMLSGDTTERVDTRVLEVIFEVNGDPSGLPLYPGQMVDVFIEGREPTTAGP
jgi:multidrug efflux pump subunit AcrA (membrane-fusion protein)